MSDLNTLRDRLTPADSILVTFPQEADQDTVAASLALYLSLQATGKRVSVINSTQPVVRDSHLVGLDQIKSDVGGQNLVITVNLPEDAVDKVTSNLEGGHLNLVLQPKPGSPALKQSDLVFGASGAAPDLIIVVGASALSDLGSLIEKEHELFTTDKLVNLSNKSGSFGSVNLTDPSASNSELITAVIQELKLPINADIASNLMQGIEAATNNLTSSQITADTFEALAVLYRAGARRHTPPPLSPAKVVNNLPITDIETPPSTDHEIKPVPDQSKLGEQVDLSVDASAKADWLKPKIFRGGNPAK